MKAQPQGWRWKATLLFALVLCSARGAIASTPANLNEKHSFDIAPGAAAARLTDFCVQSGVDLIYRADAVDGAMVAAVHGQYTPLEALDRMFAGTGIRYQVSRRHNVTLKRASPDARTARAPPDKRDASRHGKSDRRSPDAALEEVTISGTHESRIAETGSPIFAVTRADIDASGFVTAQGVVRTLPQVFGGGPTEDTVLDSEARTNVARGTGVNLRGFGAGSTLVLLNSRRLPGAGSEGLYTDISNLPLAAIERIDILPDSSSTFYGADAVGGVVNFVMRDRFVGRQTEAYFGNTTRGDRLNESYISQLFGARTESGHGLLALEFYSRGNLPAARREMARSDLTEYGGSDFDIAQANPGNIILGTTTWAIPHGQDGTNLKPGDFTKDVPNLQDRYQGADILPNQQRFTGFGTWKQDLTDRLAIFGDVLVGQRDERGSGGGATGNFIVPVTNAFYASPVALPSRVPLPMRYNFYDDLGPVISDAQVKSTDATAGIERHFSDDWQATATIGYAKEQTRSISTNVVNGAALNAALASADPGSAFNPFGDGSHTNLDTLESLHGYANATYDSNVTSASILAGGSVLKLPGGNVALSLGGEKREQRFHSTFATDTSVVPTTTRSNLRRGVAAMFAELTVPIVGPSNRVPGLEALALSFAERYERYSDFGNESTPRLGFSWAPLGGLTVRGSYSASFRPPGLLDLDESRNAWGILPLRNPQTGGVSNVLVWAGKNHDLRAESAHSWTAGLEIEPERAPEAALAVTYFSTNFTDRLSQPSATADLLSNPTLSPLVTLNPSAEYRADVCSRAPQSAGAGGDCLATPIVAIADLRMRNDAIVQTRGIDMLARYEKTSRIGKVSFSLNGTYVLSFDEAKATNLPLIERVSTQSYPVNLKMRASARWQRGPFDISAYANFMNGYRDTVSIPQRSVSSWTTFDLHAAYTLRSAGSWLSETTFALGADNLFDRNPPFLNNSAAGLGYDQENGDLLGRMVSFTVRTNW